MVSELHGAALTAPALVCLAAALFQRLTGFGFSLVATSALGLFLPLREVVVLLALPALCATGAAFLQARRDLQLGRVRSYAAWMLGTVPVGVIGLRWLPLPVLKAALAALLATGLLGRRMPRWLRLLQWTPLSGVVAGLASGALGTPGAAVVGWVHSQDLTLAQQRAASLLLFTLAGLLRLPLYLLGGPGGVSDSLLPSLLLLLPILVGVGLGELVAARLSEAHARGLATAGMTLLLLLSLRDLIGGPAH